MAATTVCKLNATLPSNRPAPHLLVCAGSERVAAAALAAAEANGAVPPLTARQRQALRAALSQAAAAATESGQSLDEDWELAPGGRRECAGG